MALGAAKVGTAFQRTTRGGGGGAGFLAPGCCR